jgi:prolyl oligopeptidase
MRRASRSSPSTCASRSAAGWRIVVPEVPKVLLEGVSAVGRQMFCEYLRDAKTEVKCFDYDGKLIRDVKLPGIGSAGGFGGYRTDTSTFYSFTSFTEPGAIYRMDLKTGESTLWRKPEVKFDGSAFETKQVFFHSKDGTKVPMFIVHKKGLQLDGSNPTLLYGYGGFNISLTPGFSVSRRVAGDGRRVCDAEPAWRRRIRSRMASGRREAWQDRTCSTTSSPPPSG